MANYLKVNNFNKFLYLIVASLCFFSTTLKAQDKIASTEVKVSLSSDSDSIANEFKKIKGTYQIQMIGTRNQPLLPSDFYLIVNKNRLKDRNNFVDLSSEIRIMILSENEIRKEKFLPIKEEIIYK